LVTWKGRKAVVFGGLIGWRRLVVIRLELSYPRGMLE